MNAFVCTGAYTGLNRVRFRLIVVFSARLVQIPRQILIVHRISGRHKQVGPFRCHIAELRTDAILMPAKQRRIPAALILVIKPAVLPLNAQMPLVRETPLDNARSVKSLTVAPDTAAVSAKIQESYLWCGS